MPRDGEIYAAVSRRLTPARDLTDEERRIIEKALIDSGKTVEVPMDPNMHLRSFMIYQTPEGWYWNWPGIGRAVGPFPTLPEVLADLQHVMGVTDDRQVHPER